MTNTQDRLQKVIARSGFTSRRKAEQLIVEGKVTVNGKKVIELGTKVSTNDEIEINGIRLEKEAPVYYLFYKPRGVISSVKDDKNRKVVTDYFPEVQERIFPIGRLDYDSSGIILLTNDGEFANLLMHPRYEVDKVYTVKVKGTPTKKELNRLRNGIRVDDDKLKIVGYTLVAVNSDANTTIIEMTLNEGKNRHIRRMMEAIGYPVVKLKRESYGMLTLKGLKAGEFRKMTPHEVKLMRQAAIANTSDH